VERGGFITAEEAVEEAEGRIMVGEEQGLQLPICRTTLLVLIRADQAATATQAIPHLHQEGLGGGTVHSTWVVLTLSKIAAIGPPTTLGASVVWIVTRQEVRETDTPHLQDPIQTDSLEGVCQNRALVPWALLEASAD